MGVPEVLHHRSVRSTFHSVVWLVALLLAATLPPLRVPAQGSSPFVKLPDPAVPPTGTVTSVAFSHDSTYLAATMTSAGVPVPHLVIYKREADTFTRLPVPVGTPLGPLFGVAFSSDSTYLAVVGGDPRVAIFRRNGDNFTLLDAPDIQPPLNGAGVAFSHDDRFLVHAHNNRPYITIYKRDGDDFSRQPDPAGLPTGNGISVSFSHDDAYMAVGHFGFDPPYLALYAIEGDIFTKLPNPAELPTGSVHSIAFSHDSGYLAAGYAANFIGDPGGLSVYKHQSGALTKLPTPDVPIPSLGRGVAFSPDDAYLAVAHTVSPRVTIYSRSGDDFTKVPDPTTLPPAGAECVAFSHDSIYLAVGHVASPYLTIYKKGQASYSINVTAQPAGGGTVSGGGEYEPGAQVTVEAIPEPEYRFVNWSEGEVVVSGSSVYVFTATSDRVLVANFGARPSSSLWLFR